MGKLKHKKYLPRELFKDTTPCERCGVNSNYNELREASKSEYVITPDCPMR